MESKREKRLQAKKRKAIALLQLARGDRDAEKKEAKQVKQSDEDQPASPRPQTPPENWEDVCREKRKLLSQRRKETMSKPTLTLLLENVQRFNQPLLQHNGAKFTLDTPPLFLFDLQHLLWYALLNQVADFRPRWCSLLQVANVSCVVLVVLDGVSMQDITKHRDSCAYLWDKFSEHIEMVSPAQYGGCVFDELSSIPISSAQVKKWKALEAAAARASGEKEACAGVVKMPASATQLPQIDCSPADLLLTPKQMAVQKFPLPVSTASGLYRDFVYSKERYADISASSPLLAVDCEMCLTSAKRNELTRVSIVNKSQEVIYDTLVKPRNPVIDYLTRFSGITKKLLDPVTTQLEDVHRFIQENLPPDAILCGQALNFDLTALKLFHPYVIDTSLAYNISGDPARKTGLKGLVHHFLGRSIQVSTTGHCSEEDAQAAMDLVKLKLEKGLQFGDATLHTMSLPVFDFKNLVQEDPQKEGLPSGDTDPRKGLFFHRRRSLSSVSAFQLLHSCGKSACVMDREEIMDRVPADCSVTRLSIDCDAAAAELEHAQVQQHAFVWLGSPDVWQAFQTETSEIQRTAALSSFQHRLGRLMQQVPKRALAVVLASGRPDDSMGVNNAAAFLTIT